MPRSLVAALAALALCAPAQQPSNPPEAVIRVSVALVQVDAVVKDAQGRFVADLKAADFEILQDGKPQAITNFTLVRHLPPAAPAVPAPAPPGAPPPPPTPIRPDQVRRTIALVVDDLGLSFEGTGRVREAVKQFVNRQVQPGDLVAIVRTGGGMGALQQFTYDKGLLHAAIEQIRFSLSGRAAIGAFAPLGEAVDPSGDFRDYHFSVGTLGALQYVIRGLNDLPGRKSIVLFSETMRIFDKETKTTRILDSLRRLIDSANRSSVVIYAIDPRGLQPLTLQAADDTTRMDPEQVIPALEDRRDDYFDSQAGMAYLAHETGGLFFSLDNDLNQALGGVLDDQAGYYLIGYRPEEGTFDPVTGRRRFHKVTVRVKRPGLRVRSRSGFYGVPEDEVKPAARHDDSLLRALTSPFVGGDLRLKLTSLFYNHPKSGSFVRSLVHIDARDLRFESQPDGWNKAAIDVLLVSFGERGQEIERSSRTYTLRLREDALKFALRNGFLYSINHPVRKPGAYQLRVAVRDKSSGRLGGANQFIDVPDLRKGRLTLSGLTLRSVVSGGAAGEPAEGLVEDPDPLGGPALRIFRPGADLAYAYQILNARFDSKHMPKLEAQLRLFREGAQIYAGKPSPPVMLSQSDAQRLLGGGSLRLSPTLRPGDYVIQIVVTDKTAGKKPVSAAQWMDFQVAQ